MPTWLSATIITASWAFTAWSWYRFGKRRGYYDGWKSGVVDSMKRAEAAHREVRKLEKELAEARKKDHDRFWE